MSDTNVRHLVLELHDRATVAEVACLDSRVPFDKVQHTLLAALTTCPACRAVQAARVVAINAWSEGAQP